MTGTQDLAACPVVELRRYTLHPGARSTLVTLFEARLVEAQEQAGMTVAGLFLDECDPDVFVWLRGFPDGDRRSGALSSFYGGPVWARNAAAANETMIDSDDVLLLRALDPAWSPQPAADRPDVGAPRRPDSAVAEVLGLDQDADGDAVEAWFAAEAAPAVQGVLGVPLAAWRTDPTPNGFPRLPVRRDRVLVWLAVFPDQRARDRALLALDEDPVDGRITARTTSRTRLLLSPTSRSAHPAPAPTALQ